MFLRTATVLSVVMLVASCAMEQQPLPSCPAPGPLAAPGVAASTPAAAIPAARWRALLVAGDDSSPAFDNGVNTLRERLAAAGVQHISVLSSSGRGEALASPRALYGGLRAAAGEACLVYMTSHGSTEGFYLRRGRCMMGAAALDQALNESCGSAPTVVVLSACHSGTFLTETMRRPNRIILAAAAADRASFGCGADNDYTYYDQCFLQQFDQATTWRELASATKTCVEGLERRLGVRQGSQPQLFVGAGVGNLRLPGR